MPYGDPLSLQSAFGALSAGDARQHIQGSNAYDDPKYDPPGLGDPDYGERNPPGTQAPESPEEDQRRRDAKRWGGLRGRMGEGLGLEGQMIDDWSTRFKNDYRQQMMQGVNAAQGNLNADANAKGFSAAMSQGAQQQGGNLAAGNSQNMATIGRQMDIQQAMAQYEQSQRNAQLEMAMQDLMNTYQGGQSSAAAAQRGMAQQMDAAREQAQNQNLGAGMSGIAALIAMGMMSDERAKKKVKREY